MSRSSSRGSDALRQRWEQEAEERQRLAEIEEQKRLARKARSERIPTAPKPKQDKVIFQVGGGIGSSSSSWFVKSCWYGGW
jgi:hypothetical protein